MFKKLLLLALLSLHLGCAKTEDPSQAISASAAESKDYIVVLKKDHVESLGFSKLQSLGLSAQSKNLVTSALRDIDLDHDLKTTVQVFATGLQGGVYHLSAKEVQSLAQDSRVDYIEEDRIISINAVQNSAPWGLDRLDQAALPLDQRYNYSQTAENVNAYVIDTGILLSHQAFGGKAVSGFDAIDGGDAIDCDGHGTHVSGTLGSQSYGVAKGVKLIAVRVLDCGGSGKISSVVAGIEWVTANHKKPAVANMSLGGGASKAIDDAVAASVKAGVTYVVAAGNENTLACHSSPARVPEAITVGSTTNTDTRSSFSNYGSCVSIFAPGSDILSAWATSSSSTNKISGTSMASPHVAGVAALYLAAHPAATPAEVKAAVVSGAISGKVGSAGSGSPNLLLNTAFLSGGNPPKPPENNILKSGVAVTALADAKNGEKQYKIEIPAGKTALKVAISGGSGDADLYVRAGAAATTKLYDCRPYKSGNNESCQISVKPGVYFVLIKAYSAYSGLSLKADF